MHNVELQSISRQIYFYLFEVFRAVGIKEHQLRYAALGTGLCETLTSIACVSVFEQLCCFTSCTPSEKRRIWTHFAFRAAPQLRATSAPSCG